MTKTVASTPSLIANIKSKMLDSDIQLVWCSFDASALSDHSFWQADIRCPDSLRTALPKRQAEYLAGRYCARAGLRTFGINTPPESGNDRAPIWPEGTVGSISHNNHYAAALVGTDRHWRGVGVDIESWLSSKVLHEIANGILTPKEQQQLTRLNSSQQREFATRVFSVKESLFKALYPLTGKMFFFQDAMVEDEQQIQLLTSLSDEWQAGSRLLYHHESTEDYLLSYILIPVNTD